MRTACAVCTGLRRIAIPLRTLDLLPTTIDKVQYRHTIQPSLKQKSTRQYLEEKRNERKKRHEIKIALFTTKKEQQEEVKVEVVVKSRIEEKADEKKDETTNERQERAKEERYQMYRHHWFHSIQKGDIDSVQRCLQEMSESSSSPGVNSRSSSSSSSSLALSSSSRITLKNRIQGVSGLLRLRTKRGLSCLHVSVMHNHLKLASLLIRLGCRLDWMVNKVNNKETEVWYSSLKKGKNQVQTLRKTVLDYAHEIDLRNMTTSFQKRKSTRTRITMTSMLVAVQESVDRDALEEQRRMKKKEEEAAAKETAEETAKETAEETAKETAKEEKEEAVKKETQRGRKSVFNKNKKRGRRTSSKKAGRRSSSRKNK